MKKILIRVALAAVILFVLAVVAVVVFLNSIVKKGVETVGPKVAKVEVRLDRANISLLSGKGELSGLFVGNPEGFKTPSAIKVGDVSVVVKPGSLLGDKIVVNSIRVVNPEITVEGGLKDNNLTKIMANLDAAAGSAGQPAEPAGKKKIQVDDFVISGGKMNLSMSLLGGKPLTVTLPDIHLTNLGAGSEGITPAELMQKVLKAVLDGSTKSIGDAVGNLGKGAVDAAKSVSEGALGEAGKATKGITDVFKKKK